MTNHRKTYDGCLVSVVIATWNRRHDLRETLVQYSQQTYPNVEMVVVDNHSTDGTTQMIETDFPFARLIKLAKDTGIAAYNIGMQAARGEIIVVSDNDSYLEPEGVEKIVQKFCHAGRLLAVVACEVVHMPYHTIYDWYPYPIDRADSHPDGYPTHLFIGSGAGIRKEVLEEVGYCPEEFFLYMNEFDLCTRIIGAGYDIRYFPDVVTYLNASPVSRAKELTYLLSFRNIIWYYWKYFPLHIALGRSLIRIPFELGCFALRRTNPIKVFRTCTELLSRLPTILHNRRLIPRRNVRKALGHRSEISTIYYYVAELLKRSKAIRRFSRT